jgi:hypothetical protein
LTTRTLKTLIRKGFQVSRVIIDAATKSAGRVLEYADHVQHQDQASTACNYMSTYIDYMCTHTNYV